MKRVAFLTMDNLAGFNCYDYLLYKPLKKIGWTAEEVSWRNPEITWDNFDAVLVRSTWDYQSDPEKFLSVLHKIDNSPAHLENSLQIIKWNLNKNYLNDLMKRGINIVDTIWRKKFSADIIEESFSKFDTDQVIIKPNVSASAQNTFLIHKKFLLNQTQKLEKIFKDKEHMIQPFIRNIIDEGEFSLFYFGGEYSHSILKKPKENDFRSQEEYGSKLILIKPPDELKVCARKVLYEVKPLPFYARIDFIRTKQTGFSLMELELIEPSLYFNMDPESPRRFALLFNEWMKKQ